MKKINIPRFTEKSGVTRKSVVIAPNLIRESVFIDKYGNQINPRTKEIIKRNEDKE